jgi:hypothetical protein
MGDIDAGLEAPVGGALVSESERGDAEERERITVALLSVVLQVRVVDDFKGSGQRGLLGDAVVAEGVVSYVNLITLSA